jgi:hypothetical protein
MAMHHDLPRTLSIGLIALALSTAACQPPAANASDPAMGDHRVRLQNEMAAAMAKRDAPAIDRLVAEANSLLGEKVGEPENADRYAAIPPEAPPLRIDDIRRLAAKMPARLEARRWWHIGLDPLKLAHPLREPADAISGLLAAHRAGLDSDGTALRSAREAGEFLLWTQLQAGNGVFPFPASRGLSKAPPFRASAAFLEASESRGDMHNKVRNGWLIDHGGDGGLQFDNGECGVAMLELHAATGDVRFLDAARRAADWAIGQPLSVNWNYNSFSVYLLAETYRATGDTRYRDAALDKALYGLLPGQLRDGLRAGRWHDPHNARPAYHYIMLRALASLATTLPAGNDDRNRIEAALRLGLRARNADFIGPGAANKDKAMETLLMVREIYRDDQEFLDASLTPQALDALERLVIVALRTGQDPLSPRGYGRYLAYTVDRAGR